MRIVFMGTPDFAVPSLGRLLRDGHQVAGVFTQPDKPQGRGYRLAPPPVKTVALERGIPVFQPATLRDGTALEQLRRLAPQLIVVVAYGKILPPSILDLPPLGCVNVHGSLLPKYRGAGPIQWSVIHGEQRTGVTTMYMAQGLDTGDMILRMETPIGEEESYGQLHDRLKELGAQCLSDTVALLEQGSAPRIPQDDALASYAPMLDKQLARLDFSKPARELHNLIRGLSPWPVAHTTLGGKRLKVHRAKLAPDLQSQEGFQPGAVLPEGKGLLVACGQGALELLEVQLEGGKRMSGEEFLRGRRPRQLGD